MRFLITFILLSILHLSVVAADRQESIVINYKSIKKSGPNFKQSSTLSKKELHSFAKGPISENIERIHQSIGNHNLNVATYDTVGPYRFVLVQSLHLQLLNHSVDYSYQFIFNCLYPKHTFW